MKKPPLYLELAFRSGQEDDTYLHEDRNDDDFLYVPISNTWQESPEDFHVHFFTKHNPHTSPYQPLYDEATGDYIVPDPYRIRGFARVYHIGICAKPQYGKKEVASEKYLKRLMKTWYSPVEDWEGNFELSEYLKPQKKLKK